MGADVKSLVDMVAPVLAKPTSDNDAFVIIGANMYVDYFLEPYDS